MRTSFVSNYYGKIETPMLMNIIGHSRERERERERERGRFSSIFVNIKTKSIGRFIYTTCRCNFIGFKFYYITYYYRYLLIVIT